MHFISKLSVAVVVTRAAFTGAQPFKKFGYRDYEVRPNDGNGDAISQYPTRPLPEMSILPISPSVDPIEPPPNSPSTPNGVTPTYGPPSVTSGFPISAPVDYSLPASLSTPTYGPPPVTSGFPISIPADYSLPVSPVTPSNGPPSITAGFPTAIPTDYSTPGPRTVTVRPLPVSSGSSVDPIRTVSTSNANHATPTYGPPLITGGFPTRLPANESAPITTKTVTLTYTLGTGVETTVITKTVTFTGPPAQQPFPTPTPDAGADPVSDAITTISTTSTTTVTITVQPTPSPPGNGGHNRPGRPGAKPCKAVPVVTVTEKETVTVTATPTAVDPTFDNPSPTEPVTPTRYPTTPDDDKVFSALPIASSSVTVPVKVPRPPYPTGTTAKARPTAPSGFFTRARPMPTGGYYHGIPYQSINIPRGRGHV
ncbi:hypothetical protein AJ78_01138 [Emergomyces pasteurianus Ep9510]|uniref:Yeast cell wall synthesis Kre9/Knh1 C-terminal domain-containing protein n=1 Tax=Emergomyces pasteurianus Ep9510 TaxID=1447872 RepID=A0A1J9QFD0_9EURO|nr:hypothetical protein AJ78_01138 [Emergomyces pasteurianus Ep9510]